MSTDSEKSRMEGVKALEEISYAHVSPYQLPSKWQYVRMCEVADIVAGVGFPKHLQGKGNGDVPVFKVGDISAAWQTGARYLTVSPNYITNAEAKQIKAKPYPRGTIIFAKVGEALRLNRRAMLGQRSIVDNNVMGLIPRAEVIDPDYLFYFMQTIDLGELSRATTVPSVRKSDVIHIVIPLAPSEQQKRIVEEIEKQFSRLDEAVTGLKRAKTNLKRYKAAVLKAAVEGKLTEQWRKENPDVEPASRLLERILTERRKKWEEAEIAKMKAAGKDPKDDKWKTKYQEPDPPQTAEFELPRNWVLATMKQLAEKVQYGTSTKASEDSIGIPVLRMGNISDGGLSLDDLKYLPEDHDEFPDLLLEPNDLLFNRTNSPELVGKTAVYTGSPNPCSFASYLIRARFIQGLEPKFISYYINSIYGRRWIKSVVSQQVGQANVNGTKLQALPVPLPPTEEQHAIVSEVENRLSAIRGAESEVDTSLRRVERLRQSILKKAFSGRLVPQTKGQSPNSMAEEPLVHQMRKSSSFK